MTIKLVFLGTSSQIPTKKRNHSSILLSYEKENILIDCGEGTQRQFRMANLNPCKVTRLLITHWHGDHVLGIPGLLQTLAFNNYNKTLYIYGPKGTKQFVKKIFSTFVFSGKISVKVEEVLKEGIFFDNKEFYLSSSSMYHGIPCNAYCFVKKGQIKIDKDKLKKTGLPSSPLLQNLKRGENITFNGKRFLAKDLTYVSEGKKISFVLDTSFNEKITKFVSNSDVLVIDSSFGDDLADLAKQYKHLTVKQAAEIAKKSNSKKLILTHLSQRYDKTNKKILNSSKKTFKKSYLAEDLDIVRI
jgi:ribonuclease Z